MATLIENIAKTKENFRNIRDAINDVGDVAGFNNLTTESVEEYPTRLNEAVDLYGLSKYEDGYADGKADGGGGVDLSKCKYIPKQATGKVITLNDVSEVYHKVKVYGDNQEVDVYGKNLLPYPYAETSKTYYGVEYVVNDDGTVVCNGTSTGQGTFYFVHLTTPIKFPKGTYYWSCLPNEQTGISAWARVGSTTYRDSGSGIVVNLTEDTELYFYITISSDTVVENLVLKPMFELGTTATKYELCTKQTITATPNGAEANSICPNMTFLADSDIAVDYYSSFGMAEKELAMWNAFTVNRKRENYTYAWGYSDYSGYAIPLGMCKPKISMAQMFYNYQGVELPRGIDCSGFDISTTTQTYHCYNTFAYAYNLIHIYDIGIPAVKFYTATFRGCSKLKSIEIIRCNEQTVFDTNCFNGCTSLTHCIFSGVIANDLNGQWCPWDDETLISLGDAVIDLYASGLGEGSRTLTLSDKCKQRLQELQHSTLGSYFDYIVAYKGWKIT